MQVIIVGKKRVAFRSCALCVLLFFFLLSPAVVWSQEKLTASTAFKAGKQSFQAKDYAQALVFFNQAQAAGLDKPAVFYNIGVCSYKLGHYEQAIKAFKRTATFPKMACLAYYNLALIAEKQDDPDSAVTFLKKSLACGGQGEEDQQLILLVQTALGRIQSTHGISPDWTRYASLGLGYDDNVAMVESTDLDLISEKDDFFRDVFGLIRSPLFYGDAATGGLLLQGNLFLRDYADLNKYDTATLSLKGRYSRKAGGFQFEGGTGYSYMLWDHSGYSQSPILTLQAGHPLGKKSSYRLRYEAKYFDMLNSSYDYLRGWQHRATTEFLTGVDRYRFILGYTLEENDRADQDYAPRRHLIQASLELRPADRVNINFSVSYRDSAYAIKAGDDREEERYDVSLFLSYGLSQKLELSGRVCHTDNNSSSPLSDFSRNIASVSLGYAF